MTIKTGSYTIGPENGRLTIKTYVGGMGSKLGHDLLMEATSWSGTVDINAENPSATRVQVTVEPRSLTVVEATGGLKPFSENDRSDIAANQDKTLSQGKYPTITFKSTGVQGSAPRLRLSGDLTVTGQTKPVTLEVEVQDGPSETKLVGRTTVTQTNFGIKPYSKLGALKVKDDIDLEVTVTLPA